MSAGFTDDQWKADGLEVKAYGRGTVAVCPTPQKGGVFECGANATLIAAAPDLFEALDTLFSDPQFQVAIGGNPNMVEALMARCNAALAKARGES